MARSVWALINEELAEHLMAHNTRDAKQWIFHLIKKLIHEGCIKVLVIIWAIWTPRRKAIHEGLFHSPLSIFSFVTNYLNDLKLSTLVTEKKQSPVKNFNYL
jgi:hypothetical protein